MGWWKIENSDDVVGDLPVDILGAALTEVAAVYEAELGRLPTRDEWQALLLAVLGDDNLDRRLIEDGVATAVAIEVSKTASTK